MRLVVATVCCASLVACVDDDSECRSQCGPSERCAEQPFESFGDLASDRELYETRCERGARWAFEAVCQDGTIVLRSGTGYTSEGRFYDRDSGEFLGLTATTDARSPPCDGKSYWPAPVRCREPIVTRVLCGDAFSEGQSAGGGVTQ